MNKQSILSGGAVKSMSAMLPEWPPQSKDAPVTHAPSTAFRFATLRSGCKFSITEIRFTLIHRIFASIVVLMLLVTPSTSTRGASTVFQTETPFNLPAGFALTKVADKADGLDQPTAFAFLPVVAGQAQRILIAEKTGLLKLLETGANGAVVYSRPVLDLRDEVNQFVDRGLVGLTVDPNFARNGYIYLLYSYDAPGQPKDTEDPRTGRLVRYTMEHTLDGSGAAAGWGTAARRNSATILLNDFKSDAQNHSVGTVRFAGDGSLFVSLGDGALSAVPSELSLRAQSLDALEGKLLRLNADGSGFAGNPFYDAKNPRSVRSRIWALGFRMPFRFGVQPETNIPYVGNVGWNSYEALYRASAGANFGWPCIESAMPRPEFQDAPACKGINILTARRYEVAYAHDSNNASITGGTFVAGKNFPPEMRGSYIFGDYARQFLRRAIVNDRGDVTKVEPFAEGIGEPVDIQFGPDGALYVLSIYSKGLQRIVYQPNDTVTTTQVVAPSNGPTCLIATPSDGDVVLPNTAVTLSSTEPLTRGVQTWRVTLNDRGRRQTLLNTTGATGVFTMPTGLSENGYVEIMYAAQDARGELRAQQARLYAPASDGYIRSWWLIGGFPYRDLNQDAIGETTYADPRRDPHAQRVHSTGWRINFADYISPDSGTMAYALTWIDVPEDRTGLLGMLSDDGIAVWLNGREIWRNKVSRYVPKPGEVDDLRDLDLPPIQLKKGRNVLLVKVDQNSGDWVFKVRVLNADGSVMRDALAKTGP